MIQPADDEVHVWLARLEAVATLERCATLLSASERARLERFLVPGARQEFLAGRACLRVLLGAYLGEPPQSLVIGATPHEKPTLERMAAPTRLRFNVSHTRG